MVALSPRFLAHGVDTAQCAYYLIPQGKARLNFTRLKSAERTAARYQGTRNVGFVWVDTLDMAGWACSCE